MVRAIQITTLGGPSEVEHVDVPDPAPGVDDVLVRVRAAGVSFPEVLQTRGRYQTQPDLPFIPGSEIAGEVVSAPAGSLLRPGDRVAAFSHLGGFSELAVCSSDLTFKLPTRVSYEEGAALPLNYGTAYFGLIERGRLRAGESVLVHGAAGGIGTASIQVARAFGAGRVVAVTSTEDKGAFALAAGADEFVLAEQFKDAIVSAGGVDVVVDPVGGDRFTDSLRCLRENGRLLVVGFTAGHIPTVRVNRLLLTNVDVVGVGWGAYAFERPGHVASEWAALLPHIESGALTPPIGRVFPLAEAAGAMLELDERRAVGKIVLAI
jgi:NADPH2:quinone reductase